MSVPGKWSKKWDDETFSFEPFQWLGDSESEVNFVNAVNRKIFFDLLKSNFSHLNILKYFNQDLSKQLMKCELIGENLYQVVDVHKKNIFRQTVGNYLLKGTGDAVILPFSIDVNSAAFKP